MSYRLKNSRLVAPDGTAFAYDEREPLFAAFLAHLAAGGSVEIVKDDEPVPETITKTQFVRACVRAGRMTHAEALAYVSQGTLPPIMQRAIAGIPAGVRADRTLKNVGDQTLDRSDIVFSRLVALGDATDAQIDDLFRLAASLK